MPYEIRGGVIYDTTPRNGKPSRKKVGAIDAGGTTAAARDRAHVHALKHCHLMTHGLKDKDGAVLLPAEEAAHYDVIIDVAAARAHDARVAEQKTLDEERIKEINSRSDAQVRADHARTVLVWEISEDLKVDGVEYEKGSYLVIDGAKCSKMTKSELSKFATAQETKKAPTKRTEKGGK